MLKRIGDIVFSFVAILILLPFWVIIGLCIRLEDGGPIFYSQQRVGKKEKLFILYKFRSMRVNTVPPLALGAVKHQHALVTRIGYLIRRFKIDETPQFINVLRGEMSLIGPRPCLPERLQTMTLQQKRRFDLRPGLTGWAEVNGNVELSWEEQVCLDLWYVKHASLRLDWQIFFSTIKVVLMGSKKNAHALNAARLVQD